MAYSGYQGSAGDLALGIVDRQIMGEDAAPPSDPVWATGVVTVAYDAGNEGYGYNGYEMLGGIAVQEDVGPLMVFLVIDTFLSIDIEGDVVAVLTGGSITIKGQNFPFVSFSPYGSGANTMVSVPAGLLGEGDVGNDVPFVIYRAA